MPKPLAAAQSSPRRRRWKIGEARSALARLAASGLSIGEFARREGLETQRLRRWQRRLGREVRSAAVRARALTPELIEICPRRAEHVEIVLRSGVIMRVAETIDPATLARLVATLERRC